MKTSSSTPRRRKAPVRKAAVDVEPQLEQSVVPYDENLLERARTQWQFGDWESLATISRDTLQHHPERAKLALLAAAGRLQTGNDAEARQLIRLAGDWGVSKVLVSRILTAGVHNSLGRAAAIDRQPQRAQQHFESAMVLGMPGGDVKLLTQARTGEQLRQLSLPTPVGYSRVGVGEVAMPIPKLPPLSKHLEALADTLKQQKAELDAQLKKQNDALNDLRKHIDGKLKQEMLNATRQLEAFLDIQSFFNNGEHLPEMHGWPVSPDFARYLIQLLEKNDYDMVLEFGSGASTVIIAKTLAKLEREHQGKPEVVQVAFEHLEKYHAQTLADLEAVGLAQSVQLTLAPLHPYQAPNGNTYSYYACHERLADLSEKLPVASINILMIVDGPPGSTGKHARYPCLPALLAHFKNANIDILLDDYARNDEKEVGGLWERDLKQSGYEVVSTEIASMEKEALLVSACNHQYSQQGNG